MSLITNFYNQQPVRLKNDEILSLDEILNKDNNWWNECHNFIQLLFPARTPSKMYLGAPVLTQEDSKYIYANAKNTLDQVINRFGYFLDSVDMTLFNHNHLRITRMLESVSLICSNTESLLILGCVTCIDNIYIDNEISRYWTKAVGETW